jgi:hypothetical protein
LFRHDKLHACLNVEQVYSSPPIFSFITMKKLLFFFILMQTFNLLAQVAPPPAFYYNGTTPFQWTCKLHPNQHFLEPTTWNTASTGAWQNVIENDNYLENCNSTPYDNPFWIITPDPAPCDYPTGTVFYKTEFVLPFNPPFCDAIMRVRADNTFRLYINGENVVGNLTGGCGQNFIPENEGLLGNSQQVIYDINIANFLLAGSNTVIVEVQNCSSGNINPSYLSADIRVTRNLVGVQDANFGAKLGLASHGLTPATFFGINNSFRRGPTNVSWKVESSDFSNGPWTTILFHNSDSPELITYLPACKWIRVTRTVTNGCSTVSYSQIFNPCNDLAGNGLVVLDVSNELNTELSEEATQFAEDEKTEYVYQTFGPEVDQVFINDPVGQVIDTDPKLVTFDDANAAHTFEVSPNPAVDYLQINHHSYTNARLKIIDLLGKVLDTWEVAQESNQTALDLHKIAVSGIYFVRLVDQASGAILHSEKVQILRN